MPETEEIVNKFNPKKGALVLDIGSNDGILLKFFKEKNLNVLGIDPMPGIDKKALKLGINTLSKFFDSDSVKFIKNNYQIPSIICSNNLFADTDDLDTFIENVKCLILNLKV